MGEYTLKDALADLRHDLWGRLDALERKLDAKVDVARVDRIDNRVAILEREAAKAAELASLRDDLLSPEKVGEMIGNALHTSSARGWSQKERYMAVVAFGFLIVNFIIGIAALGPDVIGGK